MIASDPELEVPERSAVSVITLGELRAGIALAESDRLRAERRRRFAMVAEAFLPIDVDRHVADHYGQALALARRERRTTKATDLLIIATAWATGRALYTLDERQARLARVTGIEVASS